MNEERRNWRSLAKFRLTSIDTYCKLLEPENILEPAVPEWKAVKVNQSRCQSSWRLRSVRTRRAHLIDRIRRFSRINLEVGFEPGISISAFSSRNGCKIECCALFAPSNCSYRRLANHVRHVTLFREHSDAMPLNNYGRRLTQELTPLNDKRHVAPSDDLFKALNATWFALDLDSYVHLGRK